VLIQLTPAHLIAVTNEPGAAAHAAIELGLAVAAFVLVGGDASGVGIVGRDGDGHGCEERREEEGGPHGGVVE
jgi:hypothetical protein